MSSLSEQMLILSPVTRAVYATCLAMTLESGQEYVPLALIQDSLGYSDEYMQFALVELEEDCSAWGCDGELTTMHSSEFLSRSLGPASRPLPKAWNALKERVFEEKGRYCLYCHESNVPLTLDHVVPVSRGGSNHPVNLFPSCFPCNSAKGTRPFADFIKDRR